MKNLDTLSEIVQFLGLTDIERELNTLKIRALQENAKLVLPLVGEFSAGKTSLINALTDCKKLETATKPTTATIYEVHFGSDATYATILDAQDNIVEVSDISELKNDNLADAKVITVFDTSNKVPSSTILVDTPGLSSPDAKHKQVLMDFLPKADGILLVSDINQQLTRSLTEFISTVKLTKCPIFLVLTKSDTKTKEDIEKAKAYIANNSEIPVEQIAVVSAATDNLSELYSLFANIQKKKNEIIKQVDTRRLQNIVSTLSKHIEELMKASSSNENLDEAIRNARGALERIKQSINRLVENAADKINELERKTVRGFEDTAIQKLDALVTGQSNNFDKGAITAIDNIANLYVRSYADDVQRILQEEARSVQGTTEDVAYLNALEQVDTSAIQIGELSYNISLNELGHEYDKMIKVGLIAGAIVAGSVVVAKVGAAAMAKTTIAKTATIATTVKEGLDMGNVIDTVDTATDIGSMASNRNVAKSVSKLETMMKHYEKGQELTKRGMEQYQRFQQMDDKGVLDKLIGAVTDRTIGKPQRRKAINNYVEISLVPEFKSHLMMVSKQVVTAVRQNLENAAAQMIEQKTNSLHQLQEELREHKDEFEKRMTKLREYKTILLTI